MVHGFVDDYGTRWVLKDDHRQVLAENVALYAKQVGQALERLTDDFIFRLAEKDHAYQQLMEKAIRCMSMFMVKMEKYGCWEDGCFYYNRTCASELQEPMMEAQAFLKSPEVQAWKEQQK